jgi:hypothetical protein
MSVVYNCFWASPAQSFSGPNPTGLMTAFYCFRFETPPTWRARSPYLYPPGRVWPGYTPRHWALLRLAGLFVYVCAVSETCMGRCLAKWVVPCLAPLFRLLGGVYRAVAWQWTRGSDSTIAAFSLHVTIYIRKAAVKPTWNRSRINRKLSSSGISLSSQSSITKK